jgi:transcriptional regulator with XRE-family HTH domain
MTPPQPHPTRKLTRLGRRLQRAGITRQAVALEAGVTKAHVSHVFAGRYASANVVATAERLLAERQPEAAKAS